MRFFVEQREGKWVVMAQGELVVIQFADCGDANDENRTKADLIADGLTVLLCSYLWGAGAGMSPSILQPTVWLEVKGQPIAFEGATMEQALAAAAKRIRGES